MVRKHEHVWRRYVLWNGRYDSTVKVFTEKKHAQAYYEGWECECGEQGYAVPA